MFVIRREKVSWNGNFDIEYLRADGGWFSVFQALIIDQRSVAEVLRLKCAELGARKKKHPWTYHVRVKQDEASLASLPA